MVKRVVGFMKPSVVRLWNEAERKHMRFSFSGKVPAELRWAFSLLGIIVKPKVMRTTNLTANKL
jgi:hypothetical protein